MGEKRLGRRPGRFFIHSEEQVQLYFFESENDDETCFLWNRLPARCSRTFFIFLEKKSNKNKLKKEINLGIFFFTKPDRIAKTKSVFFGKILSQYELVLYLIAGGFLSR